MKTSLSSSQKHDKFALQPMKACKSFKLFQLGYAEARKTQIHER